MSDHSGLETVESGQTKNLLRSTKQRSSLFVDMLLPKRVSVHVLIEINVPFCTLQGLQPAVSHSQGNLDCDLQPSYILWSDASTGITRTRITSVANRSWKHPENVECN